MKTSEEILEIIENLSEERKEEILLTSIKLEELFEVLKRKHDFTRDETILMMQVLIYLLLKKNCPKENL